jgi:GDPmannose 4,6-dehydratase
VREFVETAAAIADTTISWEGIGQDEKGYDQYGKCIVEVDPRYYRPAEVETLLGDSSYAREMLAWTPKVTFPELVKEMMEADLKTAERDDLIKRHGYPVYQYSD